MKQKYHLKRFCLLAFLLFAILAIPSMDAQAAKVKPKTGTYIKRFHGEGFDAYGTVIIKKITKKDVTFQFCYESVLKVSYSRKIVGKRKGSTVTFQYKDMSWGEKGKGTMKLANNYIKIKAKANAHSPGYLGTGGKWYKLKRKSGSKKFRTF